MLREGHYWPDTYVCGRREGRTDAEESSFDDAPALHRENVRLTDEQTNRRARPSGGAQQADFDVLACRVETATGGIATPVAGASNLAAVSPPHSRRKSRWLARTATAYAMTHAVRVLCGGRAGAARRRRARPGRPLRPGATAGVPDEVSSVRVREVPRRGCVSVPRANRPAGAGAGAGVDRRGGLLPLQGSRHGRTAPARHPCPATNTHHGRCA